MKELIMEKYKGSLLLKFAVVCFAAFLVVSLIGQQFKISDKKRNCRICKPSCPRRMPETRKFATPLKTAAV